MSRIDSLKNEMRRYERRLQILREQKALHGIQPPPAIVIEMEELEAEVAKLQAELEATEQVEAQEDAPGPRSPTSHSPWWWAVGGGVGVLIAVALVGGIIWFNSRSPQSDPLNAPTPITDNGSHELTSEPVSTAAPTSTAAASPTSVSSTQRPLLFDDFNGTELDGETWVAIQGAGRIDLDDGILSLLYHHCWLSLGWLIASIPRLITRQSAELAANRL